MIHYMQGNLLQSRAEALVNTVNEVGVMGKGIALAFREAFPASARLYREACRRGEVRVGRVLVTKNVALFGPRWIIHFPTKKHWRHPSQLEWIREGLVDLTRVIRELGIRSIALPPLGCGNGRLEWDDVRREMETALSPLTDVEILVYTPTDAYHSEPKRAGKEALTPARALIAESVRRYSVLGFECTNLEVQKLAWFLHRVCTRLRLPDPLDLRFEAGIYGPYSDRLRHLLNELDGSYIHCPKRLSDAGPFDPIWFDESRRGVVESYLKGTEAHPYASVLDHATEIIDGFESPLGLELLSTADWIMLHSPSASDIGGLRAGIERWPHGPDAARRKSRLFDDRMLHLALTRLRDSILYAGAPDEDVASA